jgi:hypothetical protein
MQTVFESTKEFELGVAFSDTDVFLIQECVALTTEHPVLAEHWIDAIALVITMMDVDQRAVFRFDRLYPNAIEVAVFGGDKENPIVVADDDEM